MKIRTLWTPRRFRSLSTCPTRPEGIGYLVRTQPVLSEGGLEALLELSPLANKKHPGPAKFALISDFPRRDPHRGKGPRVLEFVYPAGSELIRLVYTPQHGLAQAAWTSLGVHPACLISSTIQYQFPTVSPATGEPGSQCARNA